MNYEKGEIKMNPDTPLLIGMEEKIKDARINNIIKEPNENYWKMNEKNKEYWKYVYDEIV